jgi:hypothetical protein
MRAGAWSASVTSTGRRKPVCVTCSGPTRPKHFRAKRTGDSLDGTVTVAPTHQKPARQGVGTKQGSRLKTVPPTQKSVTIWAETGGGKRSPDAARLPGKGHAGEPHARRPRPTARVRSGPRRLGCARQRNTPTTPTAPAPRVRRGLSLRDHAQLAAGERHVGRRLDCVDARRAERQATDGRGQFAIDVVEARCGQVEGGGREALLRQALALLGVIREAQLSVASRSGLLSLLIQRGVSGRAFVEELRLHGEAPLLVVPVC